MVIKASINVIPECPISEIVEIAKEAEMLGFSRCWVYDEGLATRDVYVVMSAIASATQNIEIGPGITNPYTRHPAQTSMAIASLDELSQGRAFLGIGAGGSLTLNPLAIERKKPLSAVRDTISIARKLFSGQQTSYQGSIASLKNAQIKFARPDIEIWLAGRGPRMLALGGEKADGVMLDFIYKPQIAEYVQRIRKNGNAKICYSTAIVTEKEDLEFVRPHMTYRLVDAPENVQEAIGITKREIENIRVAMSGGLEAAAKYVKDEWVEPFIIQGSIRNCREEIEEICSKHNVDEFLVPMFKMADQKSYLRQISKIFSPN